MLNSVISICSPKRSFNKIMNLNLIKNLFYIIKKPGVVSSFSKEELALTNIAKLYCKVLPISTPSSEIKKNNY